MAKPDVKVTIGADNSGLKKTFNSTETYIAASSKKMSASIASATAQMKVALAAVTVSLGLVAKSAIDAASDLEETQGKFDVVFRGMEETAESWASTLQNSYAMAETEAKKYLSSIQDLIVPTGLARDAAGELSNKFVQLAADLGSFNNLPTEDVIRDIQSALQGSSETMAKYGINVKQAKVQQEVLNLGLAKSKEEITDAHKAMAIYSIAIREGADAMGDMERTSGSYANQMKQLKASITDVKTEIGQALLPAMTSIVTKINESKETWSAYATATVKAIETMVESADKFLSILLKIDNII